MTDDDGAASTSTTTVEISAAPSETPLFISDIRFELRRWQTQWRAVLDVRSAADDMPVAGVTLKVDFTGSTYSLTTDSNGIARTSWKKNLSSGNYYADAYDLALAGFTWSPSH